MNFREPDGATRRALEEQVFEMVKARGVRGFRPLQQTRSENSSTHPSEIWFGESAAGSVHLLLKFFPDDPEGRERLAIERYVYDSLLADIDLPSPSFFGAIEGVGRLRGIVIEYFPEALHLSSAPDPCAAMRGAARWIARFHEEADMEISHGTLPVLDVERLRHAGETAEPSLRALGLQNDLDRVIEILATEEPRVVHAEFYPKNVLWTSAGAIPVDWETTMLGPTSLDLATLTEDWSREVSAACFDAYAGARRYGAWVGAEDMFGTRMAAARFYVALCRLGGSVPPHDGRRFYVRQLRRCAERLRAGATSPPARGR